MIAYTMLHRRAYFQMLGYIPSFLDEEDPRSAAEQIDAKYIGGWFPMKAGELDIATGKFKYPGDPIQHPLIQIHFRDEILYFYDSAFLSIIQPDGTWERARVN